MMKNKLGRLIAKEFVGDKKNPYYCQQLILQNPQQVILQKLESKNYKFNKKHLKTRNKT